ncbi:MAG: VanZ family protein [Myxococcales bacterium]|jgi:VanZ family protein|nr:VanZ family protein [Myxococcales bacterium]
MTKRGELSVGLVVTQVSPVLLYVGLIFALSSLPQAQVSTLTAPWLAFPHADKAIHFIEYAFLGALGLRALLLKGHGLSPRRAFPVMLALGGLCALIDELFQATVAARDSSATDWLADIFGIFFGLLIVRLILWRAGPFPPPARASAPSEESESGLR